MKKITLFAILVLGLLSSLTAEAKEPPNGVQNYIANGHLYVWYENKYLDMGPYNPG